MKGSRVAVLGGVDTMTGLSYADWVDANPETNITIGTTPGNITFDISAVSGAFADWSTEDTAASAGAARGVSGRPKNATIGTIYGFTNLANCTQDSECIMSVVCRSNGELQRRAAGVGTNFPSLTYAVDDVMKIEYDPSDSGGSYKFFKNDVELPTMKVTGVGTNLSLKGCVSLTAHLPGAEMDQLKLGT